MNEKMIRYIFQRDEQVDKIPPNTHAIDKLVNVLKLHEKSTDSRIREIGENFMNIANLEPAFIVFEGVDSDRSFYMKKFKAIQLSENADDLVVSHELGHAFYNLAKKDQMPEGYGNVLQNSKKYALSDDKKELFKDYIQHLSKDKDDLSEEEKIVFSDIISGIFQQEVFKINDASNICYLESFHRRDYYFDENKGGLQVDKVFDEHFANYYALKLSNADSEIETFREIFGDEIVDTLDDTLTEVSKIIVEAKDKAPEELTTMDAICHQIREVNTSELININSLEETSKEQQREEKDGGR